MIDPEFTTRRARMPVWTAEDRLDFQISQGRVRVGPDAAREIARRVEERHGFWDLSRLAVTS